MGLLDTILGRTKPVRANLDALFALPSAAVTLESGTGLVPSGHAGVCWKPPAGRSVTDVQQEIAELLQLDDTAPAGATPADAAPSGATLDDTAPAGATPAGAAPDDATPAGATPAGATPADASPDDTTPAGGAAGTDAAGARATGSGGALAPARASGSLAGQLTLAEDSFGYRWLLLDDPSLEDLVSRVHLVNATLTDNGWGPQLLCSVFGFVPGPSAEQGARPLYVVYLYKRGTFYPFAPDGKEHRDSELELHVRAVFGADLPLEQDLSRWFPLWDLPVA